MNSYQLVSRLRSVRAEFYLTPSDQALYHELVAVCNEQKWKDVFHKKNSELCFLLNMSEKTLIKSRAALAEAGLIRFSSSRDKRIGCYYTFSSVGISSVEYADAPSAKAGISSVEYTDAPSAKAVTPSVEYTDALPSKAGISSVEYADAVPSKAGISSVEYTDDPPSKAVTSSVECADDPPFPPIKENIKTLNPKTRAHVRKAPPSPALVYPFTSSRFRSVWDTLCRCPKWKGKQNYALQLSLNKLGRFEEDFAVEQMERAIESNWTGVVFPGTEEKYQEWLNRKYGKSTNSPRTYGGGVSQPAAQRKESVSQLTDLAGDVLRAIAAEKFR